MNELALITGGSGDLGAAICRSLAKAGYDILLTYHQHSDLGRSLVAEIEAEGVIADAEALNLADLEAVGDFGNRVARSGRRLTVLVNCAGERPQAGWKNTSGRELEVTLNVNCVAPYMLARALAPAMLASGGGSIVNISSILGKLGARDRIAYTVSKAALIGLTKALALELAPSIRVNAILPGVFATKMNQALLEHEEGLYATRRRIPLGRLGRPEELAEAVTFLARNSGSYVTGVAWEVDGGVLARVSLPAGDPA